MAIDGYIINADSSDLKKLIYEVQKIGININQIVKLANSTNSIFKNDIEKLDAKLSEICKVIGDLAITQRSYFKIFIEAILWQSQIFIQIKSTLDLSIDYICDPEKTDDKILDIVNIS